MGHRRWVYTQGGQPLAAPVEVSEDWANTGHEGGHKSEEEIFGKLVATDGTDISTRKRHREYMKANGLTLADDYRASWTKAQAERDRAAKEGPSSKARRESIERAVHQLTNRRGK